MPADSILLSGPITHLLLVLCVLTKILSHASAKKKRERERERRKKKKKKKKALGFQISHFYWSFSGDIMAVKGLKGSPNVEEISRALSTAMEQINQ